MAKIAIYDKFYRSAEYLTDDIVGQALADSEHEVIGATSDLRQAAQQILDFAGVDAFQRPDIIIMGGTLEGELDYQRRPLTVEEPITVRWRAWWGGIKEAAGKRTTFLLPQFEQDAWTYRFPSVVLSGNVPDGPPAELHTQWNNVVTFGIAACVLSRIAETYLPEARRLGVSRDPMFDAVLSAPGVSRRSPDAVQLLRSHIQTVVDGR